MISTLNKKILNKLSKDLQVMMRKLKRKNLKNQNEKIAINILID